jgi:coatomer subunit beta'
VLKKDYELASQKLPFIKEKDLSRVALFLESQGHKKQALKITTDVDHKFELAISLGALGIAAGIAENLGENDSEHKWKQIADLALTVWDFGLAEKAMWCSNDMSGLLLLYSSLGNASGMERLGLHAIEKGSYNIAFICLLLLGRVNACIDLLVKAGRVQEAAFMALSYAPSRVSDILATWRTQLSKTNAKIAKSLANPVEYPNLFSCFDESIATEQHFRPEDSSIDNLPSAFEFLNKMNDIDRDLIQEFRDLGLNFGDQDQQEQQQESNSEDEGVQRKVDESALEGDDLRESQGDEQVVLF